MSASARPLGRRHNPLEPDWLSEGRRNPHQVVRITVRRRGASPPNALRATPNTRSMAYSCARTLAGGLPGTAARPTRHESEATSAGRSRLRRVGSSKRYRQGRSSEQRATEEDRLWVGQIGEQACREVARCSTRRLVCNARVSGFRDARLRTPSQRRLPLTGA